MRKAQTEMAHPERKTRYLPTCGRGQATDLGEEEVEAGLDVGHHRRVALWLPVDIRDLLLGDGLDDLAEDGPVAHLRLEVVDASPTLRFLCHSRRRRRVNNLMFRDKKMAILASSGQLVSVWVCRIFVVFRNRKQWRRKTQKNNLAMQMFAV